MDQPNQSTVSRFFSENRLPVSLLLISLVIVIIGLIVFFWPTSSADSDVTFSLQPTHAANPTQPLRSVVMVDVSGAVQRPGVYSLDSGQRIQDAISKAGGLSAKADNKLISRSINLATKVHDGMKIYIPTLGEPTVGSTKVLGAQVNTEVGINSASVSQLDGLPGVGEVTANKIIANRPYQTLEELVSKKVVSSKVLEQIKDKLSLD